MKRIAFNKNANFNYIFSEKFEVGLVLTGDEVKSIRNNSVSIKESYIGEKKSEFWLFNCHIGEYKSSSSNSYNPTRVRKILIKRKEQNKIIGPANKEGNSIIPISLYFNKRGFAKMLVGIGKGKKKFDKRQSLKKKEWDVKKRRLLKNSHR
ncbi:MAG: SsrA-binding protein [Alphaproteobacteria bacterium MarineAlpha5_Bin11]|nr:SsrA-binding protein [Pelagibacteraceae bacterium]PPR42285.1 MAG: SsrA-binding protein [Alphaproteobacteria bacterium MarineAlpha5_Bin11]|tara:strand:+ start:144 stop:596 length:453 start_codon:yes stop_codon:yes gene_type:complete